MAEKLIGVDCQFEVDGAIRVRQICLDGRWLPVSQGRQWKDQLGRHVLVMLPDGPAQEICLRPESLTWELRPVGGDIQTRVV